MTNASLAEEVEELVAVSLDEYDSGDATWILTSAFIILTMQSGFGLLETGMVSARNEVNIMMKNVVDVVIGGLVYWFLGYGLSHGEPSNAFIGYGDFMISPEVDKEPAFSGYMFSKYLFFFAFASTATTIVSGAVAGRLKFTAYMAFAGLNVVIYALPAHWVWAGNGWLAARGMHDFAGDGPVHLLGACNGLVGTVMLGPREGRFEQGGHRKYQPSSNVSVIFGLFMLWWGWIGFNCGSTFGVSGLRWVTACRVSMTTVNASCAGGLVGLAYSHWLFGGVFDVEIVVNGVLGALVAITAPCAVCSPGEAIVIGGVGCVVANKGNDLLVYLGIDDPVGATGVHGCAAVWGLVATGLFSRASPDMDVKNGLFHGGGFALLGEQLLGALAIAAWGCASSWLGFKCIGRALGGLRVTAEEEAEGLDYCEHSVDGLLDIDDRLTRRSSSGLRGAADRALRQSMSHVGTGLAFLDRGADRAFDGLESGLSSAASAVGGVVNSTVGAVAKKKKGRYAEGSERMRSKQDREKAEATIAKFKAAMADKSASPAKNRWKAAAAKARASAAEANAGEAKSSEAPMPARSEAPLPAPTPLGHADEHPVPPPPLPPRHADDPSAHTWDGADGAHPDGASLHGPGWSHVSAGGLVRRRIPEDRDDELITRREFEAGLAKLFKRLDEKEQEVEKDVSEDYKRIWALETLMGMHKSDGAQGADDDGRRDVEITVAYSDS